MLASMRLQRALMVVLVALLAAIGAILVFGRGAATSGARPAATSAHSPFDGPPLPSGLRAAGFSLTDQHGRRVTLTQRPRQGGGADLHPLALP